MIHSKLDRPDVNVFNFLKPDDPLGLAVEVEDANNCAVSHAEARLTNVLASVANLDKYFPNSEYRQWQNNQDRPQHFTLCGFLNNFCSSVREIAINEKPKGIQVGILSPFRNVESAELGAPIEPGSDLFVLSPDAVCSLAENNASIEIRVFDRQCTGWTPMADDICTITGADVFTKLFIAGGNLSVNDWHRDSSDVLVTVLHGRKRFEIATSESSDKAPVTEIDVVLQSGDTLLLPRARLHKATPCGEVSALLSIGIMRYSDWAYRGIIPSHLAASNPKSPLHYRMLLRSHVPRTSSNMTNNLARWRSRIPGGVGLISCSEERVDFAASGRIYECDALEFRTLLRIHGSDGSLLDDLGREFGDSSTVRETLSRLELFGLIYNERQLPQRSDGAVHADVG